MELTVKGFCPKQGKEYEISVRYKDGSDFCNDVMVRVGFSCHYKDDEWQECYLDCPIFLQCPDHLRGKLF